ncbi:MAG: hypothetical protein GEV08_23395, partial [Acidimicrobiia bacterium]|nr:hypothetical protein [Acidimicrobiia bacterium]
MLGRVGGRPRGRARAAPARAHRAAGAGPRRRGRRRLGGDHRRARAGHGRRAGRWSARPARRGRAGHRRCLRGRRLLRSRAPHGPAGARTAAPRAG